MCGRFPQSKKARDYALKLAVREEMEAPRPETWNLAPTTSSLVVRSESEELVIDWLSWGLQGLSEAIPRQINARVETARSKPLFRDAWGARRCVIPADGWYEWQSVGRAKQPYYFYRRDGEPMLLAGLWERRTFALLTTEADGELSRIHHRRPLGLSLDDAREWIMEVPPSADIAAGKVIPAAEIAFHPVSPRVNSPRNDGPELIEPVTVHDAPSQADLF